MRARCRPNPKRLKGASAVEMAIVAPVIVALIMGQIEASRLGMVAQLLTTAAREGCRVAVVPGHTQTDVQNRITTVLNGELSMRVWHFWQRSHSPYAFRSAIISARSSKRALRASQCPGSTLQISLGA